jgi:diadenosine tetraphosphate (Ap4A) HIT family hydrolase
LPPSQDTASGCPFCNLARDSFMAESTTCVAFFDGYPISPGHLLVVPRRHVRSFFDLSEKEQLDMFQLAATCKASLDEDYSPDSYNLGINDGPEAGQTIGHVHLHLVPRYKGDVQDPRGGIRWVLPEKAIYWED